MTTEIITNLQKGSVISWDDRPFELVEDLVFIDGGLIELSGQYQDGDQEKVTFVEYDVRRFDLWEG